MKSVERVISGGVLDMALTEIESQRLRDALPDLAEEAKRLGVLELPVAEWSKEQIISFLTVAVRSANPLRLERGLDPDFNDDIPF